MTKHLFTLRVFNKNYESVDLGLLDTVGRYMTIVQFRVREKEKSFISEMEELSEIVQMKLLPSLNVMYYSMMMRDLWKRGEYERAVKVAEIILTYSQDSSLNSLELDMIRDAKELIIKHSLLTSLD